MNKITLSFLLILVGCGADGGSKGEMGAPGIAGYNSIMKYSRSDYVSECENSGLIVANGLDINRNTLLEVEEVQVISYICDGKDGEDGETPATAEFAVDKIITPCGFKAGVYNESLIQLFNGEIIVYFEEGSNRFLNVLQPGSYVTSDKKKCNFYIDSEGVYHE